MKSWELLANIAESTGDERVAVQSQAMIDKLRRLRSSEGHDADGEASLQLVKGHRLRKMLCKAPWNAKLHSPYL